jgi:N-acyl-D-aspartate/D-glutamate deacylase
MFDTAFQPNAFQNDAFQIVITPITTTRGGDGWTKEEWQRAKALDKKLRKAEEKRIAAVKADQEARKSFIRQQIDPSSSKKKQNKVESLNQVSEDTPSEVTKYDALIANLERQKQDLFDAVLIRQAKAQLEQELAVLEAKRQAELDDEEALLALLL